MSMAIFSAVSQSSKWRLQVSLLVPSYPGTKNHFSFDFQFATLSQVLSSTESTGLEIIHMLLDVKDLMTIL